MYIFSKKSILKLETCHSRLQELFNEVIKHVDCTVLAGHRDKATQDKAYWSGYSKVRYPNSKHNNIPATAIDVAPYPIDWNNAHRFYMFSGFVLGIARSMGIDIISGADWDGDFNPINQRFNDLCHFELPF